MKIYRAFMNKVLPQKRLRPTSVVTIQLTEENIERQINQYVLADPHNEDGYLSLSIFDNDDLRLLKNIYNIYESKLREAIDYSTYSNSLKFLNNIYEIGVNACFKPVNKNNRNNITLRLIKLENIIDHIRGSLEIKALKYQILEKIKKNTLEKNIFIVSNHSSSPGNASGKKQKKEKQKKETQKN